MIDFTEKDAAREPCIICGRPSQHIFSHCHTSKTSLVTPEGVIRVMVYGMCDACDQKRHEFSKADLMDLSLKITRQEVGYMCRQRQGAVQ
jgi:hypothetical protein